MRFLRNRSLYVPAALAVSAAAWFFQSDRTAVSPPVNERPVLKDFVPDSYSVRSGLMAMAANLAAYKNKIEKKLESGFPTAPFTAQDAEALGRLCLDIEAFLAKLRLNVSAADYVSQLEAAEAERRALVLENAKLRSLLGAPGPSRGGVPRQLADVEKSLYRLQLHLEGLAALETR